MSVICNLIKEKSIGKKRLNTNYSHQWIFKYNVLHLMSKKQIFSDFYIQNLAQNKMEGGFAGGSQGVPVQFLD